jgi:hypothetical protein
MCPSKSSINMIKPHLHDTYINQENNFFLSLNEVDDREGIFHLNLIFWKN